MVSRKGLLPSGWKFSFWQDGKSKADPGSGGIRTLGRHLKAGAWIDRGKMGPGV